jgi:dTDP-4-dehydrorhamnose reductase
LKVLLLGPNGQVGWELRRALAPLGQMLVAERSTGSSMVGDLEQVDALRAAVLRERPDVIVNAAAYTAVDTAEREAVRARLVNATAPGMLAEAAAATGAWLVHFSTDYVFDGSGDSAWREEDPTGPLNVYGQTKLEGEELIRRSNCRHLIFRTSWVYASRGRNFLRTMLRLASEREQLKVVADQHGTPTSAELIADVTAHALRAAMQGQGLAGTHHLAATGTTSWHEYALLAIRIARDAGHQVRLADEAITPCQTPDFPTSARRPHNSRLSTQKLREAFGLTLPSWQEGVARVVLELCGK